MSAWADGAAAIDQSSAAQIAKAIGKNGIDLRCGFIFRKDLRKYLRKYLREDSRKHPHRHSRAH